MARSFDLLPPLSRAKRYREMAELAGKLAANADRDEIRLAYLNLATGWHDLAVSTEQESRTDLVPLLTQRTRRRSSGVDA